MIQLDTKNTEAPKFAKIAIVGRPNVGKSTLFNRLIGFRKSITHEQAGVTRDPIFHPAQFGDFWVNLIDTGGFKSEEEGPFDGLVSQKSKDFLQEADLILLVLDIRELNGEDYFFIEYVRKFANKTILVANKADSIEHESAAYNYYHLGFSTIIPVSASHNRNMNEIEERVETFLREHGFTPEPYIELESNGWEEEPLKIALLGKPNVGKSSLTNFLVKKNVSIVSEVAGTTRDVVQGEFSYKGRAVHLLDTAGIRRKKKVQDDVEYYSVNRAIKTIETADVVILLVSSEDGLSEQDKKIAGQVIKHGKGLIFCLSKWDLQERTKATFQKAEDKLRFQFGHLDYVPVLPLSAKNGYNVEALLNMAFTIRKQLYTKVQTATLNKLLEEWVAFTPMKVHKTQEKAKILYMTQVGTMPVQFVAFINKTTKFPSEYSRFLIKKIRENLGFSFVPVELIIRTKDPKP